MLLRSRLRERLTDGALSLLSFGSGPHGLSEVAHKEESEVSALRKELDYALDLNATLQRFAFATQTDVHEAEQRFNDVEREISDLETLLAGLKAQGPPPGPAPSHAIARDTDVRL